PLLVPVVYPGFRCASPWATIGRRSAAAIGSALRLLSGLHEFLNRGVDLLVTGVADPLVFDHAGVVDHVECWERPYAVGLQELAFGAVVPPVGPRHFFLLQELLERFLLVVGADADECERLALHLLHEVAFVR